MMIEATHIEKSFGALKVLKGIDFKAEKSEVVSIMGASGAGKSTLLQILGTLSTPDSGSLIIDGVETRSLNKMQLSAFRNKKIGFVFQFHHLLPEFTSVENVMIPALIAGKSEKEAKNSALELLGTLGLSERVSHKPSELSGGEQQRIAIARALLNNPKIIIAVEPTGNLDPDTADKIVGLLHDVASTGETTVIMSTHNIPLIDKYHGIVYKCENGKFSNATDEYSK